MKQLVDEKIPFIKRIASLDDALEIFSKSSRMDRFHAIEHRSKRYVTVYSCKELDDYFYGYMAPDTGYIKLFELQFYAPGLIILFPDKSKPDVLPVFKEQKKLFKIFKEYKEWGRILGVDNVGALNDIIKAAELENR